MPKINIGIDELIIHYFTEGKREHGEYAVEVSDAQLQFLKAAKLRWEVAQDTLGRLKAGERKHIRQNLFITKHYPR